MKPRAILYRPSKSAMTSGRANTKHWRLDIRADDAKFVDPTMGWIGSTDTKRQLRFDFDSKDEAIQFCDKHGIEWEEQDPKIKEFQPKSYASNFATDKRRYSDIAAQNRVEL